MKLFLKGDRCYSDKCAFDRRSYAPGQHGQRRPKFSDYGVQLREKQKVKRMYGLSEKQFRLTFANADQKKGITGTNLLVLLESRLDNLVNGKKVNIPSYKVKPGDAVEIRERSRNIKFIEDSLTAVVRRGIPQWLELEKDNKKGVVKSIPAREDINIPIQEQLIVELYSK
jgi:small subunit ribosomal protein S4